jgi:hypothetical protein
LLRRLGGRSKGSIQELIWASCPAIIIHHRLS